MKVINIQIFRAEEYMSKEISVTCNSDHSVYQNHTALQTGQLNEQEQNEIGNS